MSANPREFKGTSLQLSASEVKALTGWPDALVYEFLSLETNVIAAILRRNNIWTGTNEFDNFTALGGVAIKLIKLIGTTGAAAGDTVTVAHGIDLANIISLTVNVNDGTTLYGPNSALADTNFEFTADATNVNVTNGPAATAILAQAFVVTLIYGSAP